jgi:hypothetical protein
VTPEAGAHGGVIEVQPRVPDFGFRQLHARARLVTLGHRIVELPLRGDRLA